MNDQTTTIADLKKIMDEFVTQREWHQFHTPKELAMDISIEASELMEKFLWIESKASFAALEKDRSQVEDELADVIMAAMGFANISQIDIAAAVEKKMAQNRAKYPVELARGKNTKYTKLS